MSIWADMFTHLGTTSSSRIEGAHAVLKRHLTSSTGDLSTVFDKMDTVLRRQYTDIMVRSQQQQYKQNNQIRAPLFNGLTKTISKHALQMAFKKYGEARLDKLTTEPKSKLKPRTGSFTKTLGIPCAHMIKGRLMNSDNTMILKEDFHEQWWIGKTSSFTDSEDNNEDPFSKENIQSMKEM